MTSEIEKDSKFAHVAQVVDSRFYKYLVNRKFAIKEDDLIDGLFEQKDIEEVKEKISVHGRFTRKKLSIELQAEEKRQEKINQSLELVAQVENKLRPHYLNNMRKKLEDIDYVINTLIKIPQNIQDILDVSYNPNSTMKKIAEILAVNSVVSNKLISTVNNTKFRRSIGRVGDDRRIDNLQSAIGYIGINGFKALLPFLIFKDIIKDFYQVFPGMTHKIWKYALGKAVCANHILTENGHKDPMMGYIVAFVSSLGVIAIYHQFYISLEEVKLKKLEDASKNKKFDIYDAIFSSEPDEAVMSEMLIEFSATLPVQILEKLNWNIFPEIRNAIIEESNEVPLDERSDMGKVLRQSISYSKFELLRRAKFFSKDHVEPFLESGGLTRETMKSLISQNLRVLDLKPYVGK